MIALLLFLILAVILVSVFSHMALYVIGSYIGLFVLFIVYIIKRRKTK